MKIKYLLICIFVSINTYGAETPFPIKGKLKTKSYFGSCPTQSAGKFTLKLLKIFEETQSLKQLKEKIVADKLQEKHFISKYDIAYNPNINEIKFKLECPSPLMKVQIYKDNGVEYYTAILVETGELFDPTYEHLLRSEKKLKAQLPSFALPVADLDKDYHAKIAKLISESNPLLKKHLSEVILDQNKKLTIILSFAKRPVSAFIGNDNWESKLMKLSKVLDYMTEKKKIPVVVNLTNEKKVVVKFADKH